MINVLVSATEDFEGFEKFIQENYVRGVKFFVGVTEDNKGKIKKTSGVEIHTYKNGSNREEIINALHKIPLKKGKIIVVRRPLTKEEFSSLCESDADIVSFKKPKNKFVSFFKDWTRKIVRRIFSFKVFDDISAVCFGENMFEFMQVCPNLSTASRIDKFVGVECQEIETTNKSAKTLYSRFANILVLLGGILLFLGSLAGGILIFTFVKNIWIIFVLLILLWWFLAFVGLFVSLITFSRNIAVGKVRYNIAEEVKSK